jgi:hypothetical protein
LKNTKGIATIGIMAGIIGLMSIASILSKVCDKKTQAETEYGEWFKNERFDNEKSDKLSDM